MGLLNAGQVVDCVHKFKHYVCSGGYIIQLVLCKPTGQGIATLSGWSSHEWHQYSSKYCDFSTQSLGTPRKILPFHIRLHNSKIFYMSNSQFPSSSQWIWQRRNCGMTPLPSHFKSSNRLWSLVSSASWDRKAATVSPVGKEKEWHRSGNVRHTQGISRHIKAFSKLSKKSPIC